MEAILLSLVLLAADPAAQPKRIDDDLYWKIDKQIKLLDDDEFEVRQGAIAELKRIGEPAVRFLVRELKEKKDAEIQANVTAVLNHYLDTIRPTNYHVLPWIDCLPKNYPDRQKVIDGVLPKEWKLDVSDPINGIPIGAFTGYRCATRQHMIHLVVKGKTRADIVKILDEMVKVEKAWVQKGGRIFLEEPPLFVLDPPSPADEVPVIK